MELGLTSFEVRCALPQHILVKTKSRETVLTTDSETTSKQHVATDASHESDFNSRHPERTAVSPRAQGPSHASRCGSRRG
jgi:hypothetical protein